MQHLDRASPTPLYVQLLGDLKRRVSSGDLHPGDPLPPEPVLCELYGVSRHTLRQAVDQLVREGLVLRHRGRGTVVARARFLEQPLGGIYSFARDMAQRGLAQHSEVLAQELGEPSEEERVLFDLEPGERMFRLKRLRFLEDAPLVLELLHIPRYPGQALLHVDLRTASVYELMESQAGVVVTRAHEVIRAGSLEPEEAELLRTEVGASALTVERFGYAGPRLVEWRESVFRGDRFAFRIELPRTLSSQRSAPTPGSIGHLIYGRRAGEAAMPDPRDDELSYLPLD